MTTPFGPRASARGAIIDIHDTIERALGAAGLHAAPGLLQGNVGETIRRALAQAGIKPAGPGAPADSSVIDVEARFVGDALPPADGARVRRDRKPVDDEVVGGRFIAGQFSHAAGSRSYKLYMPFGDASTQRPLLVLLHGCTQSADDFAAGTRMNRLADEHGFAVLYPEQSSGANASKCWNWFSAADQQRGSGEPALIAGLVNEVASHHAIDRRRIYVAGLSAGAAMAVVMGETYPELFAAVGAHSGLPYAAAHDVGSALAAMKGGRGLAGKAARSAANPSRGLRAAVPTIVFHGDRDHIVQLTNGEEIVAQALDAHAGGPPLVETVHDGSTTGGRRYQRVVHADARGRACVESWWLHGAGHAWSGGDASGSYTDSQGPDASAELVRFFLDQPVALIV